MSRSEQLARRRAELVARSARLRGELAQDGARFGSRLAPLDRGITLARSLTGQPLLLAAGAALLLSLRPLRTLKWATRGVVLWSVARRLFSAFNRNEPAA